MSTQPWKIDETHSGIHFSVRHLVVAKVHGQFRRWNAELSMDDTDLTKSSVTVTIEAASIDTGDSKRDAHLRSPTFFDTGKFPALTFRSRRIERTPRDVYRIVGELTIRDVTKEITLEMEHGGFIQDPWGLRRGGFAAKGSIDRSDFGMQWNQILEAGGVAVADRIDIAIEIEAVAQAAKAVA
jgi:polyisoprenoid-binding protein YceI